MLTPGTYYTKKEIYHILNVPTELQRGAWDTGLHHYAGESFVFANVNTAGRTGHNYDNHWEADELVWYGKAGSHRGQLSIQRLLHPQAVVHIFSRTDDRAPFYYEGKGRALRHTGERPISIAWGFDILSSPYPYEVAAGIELREGLVKEVLVNVFERNPAARRICISHYGASCSVCEFNFEDEYGKLGKDFIHVHHLIPLASIAGEYVLDPIRDLRPVCPNCHAMLHRVTPPLSIEALRQLRKRKIS